MTKFTKALTAAALALSLVLALCACTTSTPKPTEPAAPTETVPQETPAPSTQETTLPAETEPATEPDTQPQETEPEASDPAPEGRDPLALASVRYADETDTETAGVIRILDDQAGPYAADLILTLNEDVEVFRFLSVTSQLDEDYAMTCTVEDTLCELDSMLTGETLGLTMDLDALFPTRAISLTLSDGSTYLYYAVLSGETDAPLLCLFQ